MAAAQPIVRAAVPADAEPVAAIFAHYVTTSVATFEEVAPASSDWRRRFEDLTERSLPFLVAEAGEGNGPVCGFAYAAGSASRRRAACPASAASTAAGSTPC